MKNVNTLRYHECLPILVILGLAAGALFTAPSVEASEVNTDRLEVESLPEGYAGIRYEIRDREARRRMPARVRIRNTHGKDHVPEGAVVVPIAHDQWFASPSIATLAVPAGEVSVRIERGPEYRPVKTTFVAEAGTIHDKVFELERWINLESLGYTSGENHLHIEPKPLAAMLAAEDLNFGTSLTWWNGQRVVAPPGKGFIRDLVFDGVVTPTSVYDGEIEHAWGAVYIVGQPKLIGKDYDGARANLPIVRKSHEAGALVCYQGGWSREVLVNALLGYVDVVNVCNNNFHRHMYQPRKHYSNLLGVEGFPDYPNTPEGMIRLNEETYYRLLNCGLRLAAGAGSATGAKTTPVGFNRAYVRAGSNPTLPEFLEAWRRGRNFVTNGPMIFMETGNGRKPGDEIAFGKEGGEVRIVVRVASDVPLKSVEVVANGRVIHEHVVTRDTDRHHVELETRYTCTRGTWLAARCRAVDDLLTDQELAEYHMPSSRSKEPNRLRFGHTSPIYVTVDGRGPRVKESLDEARRMLDAFERFARQRASEEYRHEILEGVELARERWSALADAAVRP